MRISSCRCIQPGCAVLWAALLAFNAVLASEPADARARPEPAAGYAKPNISAQALDTSAMGTGVSAERSMIERDIAQLVERVERPSTARATPPASNRRPRLDAGPIASPADAAWLLGLIYAHGAGVPQDLASAQLWFERAAARSQPLAGVGLAWCALEGCKTPSNTALARSRIAALRSSQSARALYLEWLVQNRVNPIAASAPRGMADNTKAYQLPQRELLVQAANLGDIHALLELGLEAVALAQPARARQWFEQAAAQGSGAAVHNLRVLTQQEVSPDTHYNANASLDAATLLAMAQRLHRGQGQPANYSEAIRLYRLAQDQGSTGARDMLALIFSRPTATGQLDIAWMQRIAPLQGPNLASRAASTAGSELFQRERSPLFDYLPSLWKARVSQVL
jgi:uncharacterized protein